MTLVAAYQSAGVPILLGDFLISSGSDRHRGRKKICRIRDNLVIGWTGNLVQAEQVLARLAQGLGVKPSKESLSDCFATYRAAVAGDHSVLTFSEGDAHDIWVMSPVGATQQLKGLYEWLRQEVVKPMDLTADYYAGMVMFAAPTAPASALPILACPWDGERNFRSSRGRFEFHIEKGAVEQAYRHRAESYAAAPYPLGQAKF